MSAHTTKGEAGTSIGIVVGEDKRKRALTRKTTIVVAIGVTVLVFAAAVIWWVMHRSATPTKATVSSNSAAPISRFQSTFDKALELSLAGQYNQAQQLLDSAITKTTDKTQKATLYSDKAVIAYNALKYSDGLGFAQTAENINPTAESASSIAINAEALGNNSMALEYYKKELQRGGTAGVRGGNDSLVDKIKSLGGQP